MVGVGEVLWFVLVVVLFVLVFVFVVEEEEEEEVEAFVADAVAADGVETEELSSETLFPL